MRVPLVATPSSKSEAQPDSDHGSPPPRARVLVVDDDADIRETVASLVALAGNGRRPYVSTAGSGEEAIALMAELSFSLLVTDYHLGGADGLAVLSRARAASPGVPCIFMTADPEAARILEESGLAVNTVLMEKPFGVDPFVAVVMRALGVSVAAT